jgi:hypothetical protein
MNAWTVCLEQLWNLYEQGFPKLSKIFIVGGHKAKSNWTLFFGAEMKPTCVQSRHVHFREFSHLNFLNVNIFYLKLSDYKVYFSETNLY